MRSPADEDEADRADVVIEAPAEGIEIRPLSTDPWWATPRPRRTWRVVMAREVQHTVADHDPVRSLPPLIALTPAPHPRDPRHYYARVWDFSHGVATEVQPLLKKTTQEDGFPFFLSWSAFVDNERIRSDAIDLAATLGSMRFELEGPSGAKRVLQVLESDKVFGAFRMLFVVSPAGIELREGSVDGSPHVKPTEPLSLAWVGGPKPFLREPGRWRVRLKGELRLLGDGSLSYESSWMEFDLEPTDTNVLPLQEVTARAAEWLDAARDEDAPAKLRAALGENTAGNRMVIFDRGPGAEDWTMVTTLVEQDPSGKLVGLWSSARGTCVAEGTIVQTDRGAVPIERVRVGDQVLSYDALRGVRVWSGVQHISSGRAEEVLVVNHDLELTAQHPIWIDGEWRKASALQRGMHLMAETGEASLVTSVEHRFGTTQVYDLSVEAPHNYFADGVLVHNKSVFFPMAHAWRYDKRMAAPDPSATADSRTRLGEPYEKPPVRGSSGGAAKRRPKKPALCKVEDSWAHPVFAEPGPKLDCDAPCDEVYECGFVQWVPSGMTFDCPGELYLGTTSHENRRYRPVLPEGFPVRIRIVKAEAGLWVTVRARERRAGYAKGEIILAHGRGQSATPPGRRSFLNPLEVELSRSGRHIEFRDRAQWTRMTDNADCYSADGRYFLAFASWFDEQPRFLVLNAAHGEER
jgi:hypothetical protein